MREVVLTISSGNAILFENVKAYLKVVISARTRGFRGEIVLPDGVKPEEGSRLLLKTLDGRTAAVQVAGYRTSRDGSTRMTVKGGGWRAAST